MADRPSFYITTAIAYPNGTPHIGFAYEVIATDVIARFKRLDGYDVFFLTGTDEHGLKIKQTAEREGLTPRQLVDRNSDIFRTLSPAFNISNDGFIRTTEERHYRSCQELWRRMVANGDVYLSKYAGWYSVRDEAYYAEGETTIGADGVRVGGQGSPVEWTEEENYRFRLSAYQDRLLEHYQVNPDFIYPPERRNEVVKFVEMGLEDLSISRTTFDWGIPVPDAPGHVMYVWIDALTNYITGVGFPDENAASYKRFWPADVHLIGKDVVRFHAVYWPAFLMSAGIAVPKRIVAHGHINSRGEKMSKSLGNVVDPFEAAKTYGVDQLRYFFLREVPFGQDGNYSHEQIVARINADLANNLGNLAQRSLSMINKNCDGRVPAVGALKEQDHAILAKADGLLVTTREALERCHLNRLLEQIWGLLGDANRYFDSEEPWKLKKTDPARMETVLYVTAEIVRQVEILVQPFVPNSAAKLLDQLAIAEADRMFAALGPAGRLTSGAALPVPSGVFPRFEEPAEAGAAEKPAKPPKPPKSKPQPKPEPETSG